MIQPLVFSRVFLRSQRNNSALDRELTAIVLALKHFRYFLEAREFTIFTDQKPTVAAVHSEADRENATQVRQLAFISEFTTDVRHLPGSRNVVADTLFRQEINAIFQHSVRVDWEGLAKAQLCDQQLLDFAKVITRLN